MTHCPHCGVDLEPPKRSKPRSVPQHRRFFAMVNAAFDHWPESHRFKPVTADRLRKWLCAKAGYATVKTVDTNGMTTHEAVIAIAAELATADPVHFTSASLGKFYVVQSKSIDFDTLPHLQACAVFDAVAEVIEAETSLKVDQIMPPISNRLKPKEQFAEVPI